MRFGPTLRRGRRRGACARCVAGDPPRGAAGPPRRWAGDPRVCRRSSSSRPRWLRRRSRGRRRPVPLNQFGPGKSYSRWMLSPRWGDLAAVPGSPGSRSRSAARTRTVEEDAREPAGLERLFVLRGPSCGRFAVLTDPRERDEAACEEQIDAVCGQRMVDSLPADTSHPRGVCAERSRYLAVEGRAPDERPPRRRPLRPATLRPSSS